jgi:parallel beta-helix repeat protein
MKTILINLIIFITLSNALAQTSVNGGNVNGIWTKSGSPYTIKGSIQILNGDSLILEPGVKIVFQNTHKLLVLGKLTAIGTPKDSIVFTAENQVTGWRGIRFDGTPSTNDTSRISYCKIEFGNASGPLTPEKNGGGIFFENFSKAVVSNSSIVNCKADHNGGGIYIYACSPIIKNCLISGNSLTESHEIGAGICIDQGGPKILNNRITNNFSKKYFNITVSGIYCKNSNSLIFNNVISNHEGNGITVLRNYDTIANNFIYDNGIGISCTWGGGLVIINNVIGFNKIGMALYNTRTEKFLIVNNLITNNSSDNGAGIYCIQSSPIFINNTIVNNKATKCGGALYCSDGSYPVFQNCIIWGNTASVSGSQLFLYDEKNDPDFYNCNIEGGSNAFEMNGNFFTGKYVNNINSDPLFVSPSNNMGTNFKITANSWALQKGSPCIDKGDNKFNSFPYDIGSNPRINNKLIDMGAFEFNNSPLPLADFNVADVCKNDSTRFINKSLYGTSYYWDFGDGNYSNLQSPIHKYKISGKSQSFKVILLVTGNNNQTDIIEKITIVKPIPNMDFEANDVCETKPVQFINMSDKGISVTWKFGDGILSNIESPSYRYKVAGIATTFNVTLVGINKEGCTDSITKSINVNANPISDFTYSIIGKQVDFTANQNTATKYKWEFGNGDTLVTNNFKLTYKYVNSLNYTVCLNVTNAAGCITKTCKSIAIASVNKFTKDNEIKIFPNPNNGMFTISQANLKGNSKLEIINHFGEIVYNEGINQNLHYLNLNLDKGIYILRITNGEDSFYEKLVFNK